MVHLGDQCIVISILFAALKLFYKYVLWKVPEYSLLNKFAFLAAQPGIDHNHIGRVLCQRKCITNAGDILDILHHGFGPKRTNQFNLRVRADSTMAT